MASAIFASAITVFQLRAVFGTPMPLSNLSPSFDVPPYVPAPPNLKEETCVICTPWFALPT